MQRLIPGFLAIVFAFPLPSLAQGYRAPVGQEFARVAPGGTTILPNGRILTPLGDRLYTGGDLWNVVPSPDGKWIAGMCESGIVICSSKEPAPRSPRFAFPGRRQLSVASLRKIAPNSSHPAATLDTVFRSLRRGSGAPLQKNASKSAT